MTKLRKFSLILLFNCLILFGQEDISTNLESNNEFVESPVLTNDEYYRVNIDDLNRNLSVLNKKVLVYSSLQYTSISLTFLGLIFILVDAFIETGNEFTVLQPSNETNPIPTEKKSEFGPLTAVGGSLMTAGVAGAIGFSFPAKKYSIEKMKIDTEIKKIENTISDKKDQDVDFVEIIN